MSLGDALALVGWSAVMFLSGGWVNHVATKRSLERLIASRQYRLIGEPEECMGMTSAGLCGLPYGHEGRCS